MSESNHAFAHNRFSVLRKGVKRNWYLSCGIRYGLLLIGQSDPFFLVDNVNAKLRRLFEL
jgi:hypothetical protein